MSEVELAVRAIVYKDGRLLVMKRDKHGKQYITLPGGGVDEGETPSQAIVREIKEETRLSARVNRQVYEQRPHLTFPRQYVYLCSVSSDDQPKLDHESIEYKLNKTGDKYDPVYMSFDEIKASGLRFFPEILLDEIKDSISRGFPKKIKKIG